MATRTKPVNASQEVGMRTRDAGRPSAPIRVSDEGRSISTNTTSVQQTRSRRRDGDAIPERPSTSGGNSPQFSARKEIERRRAKDDLHFNPFPTNGRVVNSYTPPLPGALPTPPADTSKYSPSLLQKPSFQRTDTPESMMNGRLAVLNAEHAGIGMALGSPSQPPGPWQSPSPFESSRSWSPDDQANASVPLRQKSSKWKLLGGLFAGSKKHNLTSEPQPFYHLQPESVNHGMEPGDYVNSPEPRTSGDRRGDRPGTRGRAYSERKTSRTKPDMRRAHTVPMNFDSQNPERERARAPKITLDGEPMGHQVSQNGGLMLNVDIPSIEMERYSVMFGSVLQKPPSASSSSLLARRQATLQKLKDVAESLPTVMESHSKEQDMREDNRQLLPRRASSPQPTKSPAFSLFPNPPSRPYAKPGLPSSPQQPRAHRRANTSPAIPSPSFATFPSKPDFEMQSTLLISPSPKSKDHISSQMRQHGKEISKNAAQIPATYQRTEPASTHERSRKTSNASIGKVEDNFSSAPFQSTPNSGEPARRKMSSPHESAASHFTPESRSYRSRGYSVSVTAANASTTTTSPRNASIQKNPPMRSPPPTSLFRSATLTTAPEPRQTRTPNAALHSNPVSVLRYDDSEGGHTDDEEREKKLRTAADVSIARQISVSREQTRMIIPIRSPSTNRANTPNAVTIGQKASPLRTMVTEIEKSAAGRSGSRKEDARTKTTTTRFAAPAAKPNTPTLVVVGGDSTQEAWEGATAINGVFVGQAKMRSFAEHRYRKSEKIVIENINTSN